MKFKNLQQKSIKPLFPTLSNTHARRPNASSVGVPLTDFLNPYSSRFPPGARGFNVTSEAALFLRHFQKTTARLRGVERALAQGRQRRWSTCEAVILLFTILGWVSGKGWFPEDVDVAGRQDLILTGRFLRAH